MSDTTEQLARVELRLAKLERIFAGNIVEYDRREAAAEIQRQRDQERRDVMGENTAANREKLAQQEANKKFQPMPQDRAGVLENEHVR